MKRPAPTRRSRLRDGLYALGFTLFVLGGVNELVEWLERRGAVETHRRDDAVEHVEERLFERDGDIWRTTEYAEQTMASSQFAARKGDTLRLFLVGGSFAMGSPYRMQGQPDRGGGIDGFLRQALGDRPVEVINAGAGAQNSTRARAIVAEVLDYQPDALLVASCNNEGEPSPGAVRQFLQKQGAFRLLRNVLRPELPAQGGRSWFTLQDAETERIRRDFGLNLRAIVADAEARGVPVLLATLPVNLSYRGFDTGGHVAGALVDGEVEEPPMPPATEAGYPVPPIPSEFGELPPCQNGVLLFEAGHPEPAIPLIRRCLEEGIHWPRLAPFLRSYVALAELEAGYADRSPTALPHLQEAWGECVAAGMVLLHGGDPAAAVEQLQGCDESPEALRWLGLALRAAGQVDEARRVLEQSVELAPRNRCRPSFNALVRQIAAEHPASVTLVDLEAAARRAAPDGIPGSEQYIDYCHMNWRGYATMAAEFLRALPRALPGVPTPELDVEAAGRALGLPPGDNREQLQVTSTWTEHDAAAQDAAGRGAR